MCSSSALVSCCVLVGCLFVLAAVSGIGLSLFLLFGDPFYGETDGTYEPSFEDIGTLICSSIYLCNERNKPRAISAVLVIANLILFKPIFLFFRSSIYCIGNILGDEYSLNWRCQTRIKRDASSLGSLETHRSYNILALVNI